MAKEIKVLRTKTGKGLKFFSEFDGLWCYCSLEKMSELVKGEGNAVQFNTIDADPAFPQGH